MTAARGGGRFLGNTCRQGDAAPADRCVNLPHASNWLRWRPVFEQVLPCRSRSAASQSDPYRPSTLFIGRADPISRRHPERIEFPICGAPFDETTRTSVRRLPKQARRFVPRARAKRKFAHVKIGFADLTLFLRRVRIISGDEQSAPQRRPPCPRRVFGAKMWEYSSGTAGELLLHVRLDDVSVARFRWLLTRRVRHSPHTSIAWVILVPIPW
jgi:hypothetical protein